MLVNIGLGLFLNIRFQTEQLRLLPQQADSHFQTLHRVQLAQQCDPVSIIQAGILGDGIGNKATAFRSQHPQLDCLNRMLRHFQIAGIESIGFPTQSAAAQVLPYLRIRHSHHIAHQEGLCLTQFLDPGAADTGDKNPDSLIGRAKDLLDLGDRTDGVQIIRLGIIHRNILLGDQQDGLVSFHGFFQSQNRLCSADFKMDGLIRIHRQTPQSQNGQLAHKNLFAHRLLLSLDQIGPKKQKGGSNLPPDTYFFAPS